ncbi:DNA repair protein RecO [candidate division KSB1 bacterium]
MPLESTDAFVVRTQRYQETSKIVTLYTKKFGKIALIAKGIRKADSKVGGILEVINLISLVFYYKSSRNIQLLKECELLNAFLRVRDSFEKTSVTYAIFELINRSTEEEEPNERLFNFIYEILKNLNEASRNTMNFYWYFVLKFLDILGFNINFGICAGCGKNILPNEANFKIEKGGVYCKTCSKDFNVDIEIAPETFKVLCKIQEISLNSLCNLTPSKRSGVEISQILHRFMSYHIEGFKVPTSLKMV